MTGQSNVGAAASMSPVPSKADSAFFHTSQRGANAVRRRNNGSHRSVRSGSVEVATGALTALRQNVIAVPEALEA